MSIMPVCYRYFLLQSISMVIFIVYPFFRHREMVQLAKNRELQPFLPKDHLGIWLAFLDKGHRWHRVKIEAKTEGDSQQSQWQFRDLDSAQIYTSSDETKFYQIPARWKAVAPQSILLEVPFCSPKLFSFTR